jgi:hypothetical protein
MKFQLTPQATAILLLVGIAAPARAGDHALPDAQSLVQKVRQGVVVARIAAALIDRKDLHSRYIRVRYDGRKIQLAGFLANESQSKLVEQIAETHGGSTTVTTHWSYEKDLEKRDPYMTQLSEQAIDAKIWANVHASLRSPAARGLLASADVLAVDVRHGKVRVFLVLDGPPDNIDISPHVVTIPGVKGFSCRVTRTYE